MNKTLAVITVAFGISVVGAIIVGLMVLNISNSERRLRNQITAKQRDNQSELDNVQKKISQTVQVTDLQKQMLMDVIVGNAQARKGGSGSLATFVTEAVPNVDVSTFQNLQNIIAGSRDAWTMRQKELLDLKREHDNLIDTWPASMIVGSRGKITVITVTSARSAAAFESGQDNDISLK